MRREQRRPRTGQGVLINLSLEAAPGDVRLERLGLAAHTPVVSAQVAQLAAGSEAELMPSSLDDRLDAAGVVQSDAGAQDGSSVLPRQPGDQIDPGQLAEAEPGALVG